MRGPVSSIIIFVLVGLCAQALQTEAYGTGRMRNHRVHSRVRMSTSLGTSPYSAIVDGACAGMKAKVEAGEAPEAFVTQVNDFLVEYAKSNEIDGTHPETFKVNVGMLLKSVGQALADPFQFAPNHKAIREPFDYYTWCVYYTLLCCLHTARAMFIAIGL